MQTRKPISTVSFNSLEFLLGKLKELTQAGQLEFWSVVEHQPEPDEINDEAGHKVHYHVYMEPAKQVQTTALREQFKEPDPVVGKPKGCLQIQSSKFDDWYLYALHDPAYLASKKQSRVYSYEPEQVMSSDADDLQQHVAAIDYSGRNTYLTMYQYIVGGKTFAEYMVGEYIGVRDVIPHERAWKLMTEFTVKRDGRPGHANDYTDEPARFPVIDKTTLPKIQDLGIVSIDDAMKLTTELSELIKT